jgi:hypothetical protein
VSIEGSKKTFEIEVSEEIGSGFKRELLLGGEWKGTSDERRYPSP